MVMFSAALVGVLLIVTGATRKDHRWALALIVAGTAVLALAILTEGPEWAARFWEGYQAGHAPD